MNSKHLLAYVIDVALEYLCSHESRMNSPVARALLLGTAMVESDLKYLQQLDGPAVGLWQMEPDTHQDIWASWLFYRQPLAEHISALSVTAGEDVAPKPEEMRYNLLYAAAMARMQYWRSPEALPQMHHASLASYWKRIYNTVDGAGTRDRAAPLFKRAIYLVEATPQGVR